jgi:hypothetical protein
VTVDPAAYDDVVALGLCSRTSPPDAAPLLHPDLAVLAPLLGEWSGAGHGSYPTIEGFDYVETLHFTHSGKPFVSYVQSSCHAGDTRALHTETGYLRPVGSSRVELVVAQPTGIVEVDEGALEPRGDGSLGIRMRSRVVGLTSSAKEVTEVERCYHVEDDVLRTSLSMAAVGQPLTHHLASELHRRMPRPTATEVMS